MTPLNFFIYMILFIISGISLIFLVAVIINPKETIHALINLIIYFYKKITGKLPKEEQNKQPNKTQNEVIWKKVILNNGTEFFIPEDNPRPEQKTLWLPYIKRDLLTRTEFIFWKQLHEICSKRAILICPKVRMEDFLEVTKKNNTREAYRSKVKSRHIDFILCDYNMKMLAGIELDDKSHSDPKAQKIDKFKNEVFETIGLPLFRIPVSNDYKLKINSIINNISSQ